MYRIEILHKYPRKCDLPPNAPERMRLLPSQSDMEGTSEQEGQNAPMNRSSEGSQPHSGGRITRKLLAAFTGRGAEPSPSNGLTVREEITFEAKDMLPEPAAVDAGAASATSASQGRHASHGAKGDQGKDRRSRRRALISAPVRVQREVKGDAPADDISTTLDVSRSGILLLTSCDAYERGMEVKVTFPYSKSPVAVQAEQEGRVVRVTSTHDGRIAVAISLENKAGANAQSAYAGTPVYEVTDASKPLVMVVDADPWIRSSIAGYLGAEGYEVVGLSTAREAREALETLTPRLLIAEIEGQELPGYDLCAHVKATPKLEKVPVVLMTSSAYPSDYSNAHSLGAVVCMAKPYRQERLGHVVRLLAPTAEAIRRTAPARCADPQRRHDCGKTSIQKKRSRFQLYR
jgi:CheY-like chemotaxis protein